MRAPKLLAVLLFGAASLVAQTAPTAPAKQPVSFDKNAFDTTAQPCQDFYQYVCGGWMKNNPLPADKSRYGRFNELDDYNLNTLHAILEKASGPGTHSALEQKIGDYYGSCMDTKTTNALGAKPIEPTLAAISKINTRADLMKQLASLSKYGMGGIFSFGVGADMHDAKMNLPSVGEGGLTLPDRDYYIKDDAKSVETRQKYVEHVQKMFELLGEKPEQAAADAKTVLAVETKLATPTMDRVSRRDPKNRDHRMSVADLSKLGPNFDFPRYFTDIGAAKFTDLNVSNPDYIKTVNAELEKTPIADWKTYLRWRVLDRNANLLSDAIFNEDFDWTRYMTGAKEPEARWKRCTRMTDRALGEVLGQYYVDQTFGKDGKERTLKLVKAIENSMEKNIDQLDWMSAETKPAALKKLHSIVNNIGYPDVWKDYKSVKVARNDLVGNSWRATEFEVNRMRNRIGKPVDKKEWGMTPPTVNAYYRPSNNDINFPAGILQPPFFSRTIDDAVNYGGIGVVIGHELTHGFDDQGRKFDADGNLKDWWTDADGKEFERRANCFVDEYSNFVAVKDDKGEVKLNGKLTLGENTADNGGLRLAYMALKDMMGDQFETAIDGFTPAQRFFIGYGQIWCQNLTDQSARQLAITDPHSQGKYRVNGVVSNSPEFQKAFGCKAGDPMVRENQCRVW